MWNREIKCKSIEGFGKELSCGRKGAHFIFLSYIRARIIALESICWALNCVKDVE